MDERIEHDAPRKAVARENPRQTESDRQGGEHRDAADLQRQRDDLPFIGRQHQGVEKPWRAKIARPCFDRRKARKRSEKNTTELQSLMRIAYAGICLNKKKRHRRKKKITSKKTIKK